MYYRSKNEVLFKKLFMNAQLSSQDSKPETLALVANALLIELFGQRLANRINVDIHLIMPTSLFFETVIQNKPQLKNLK